MKATTHQFKIGEYQCFVINDGSLELSADYLIGSDITQEQLAQVALDFELDPEKISMYTSNLLVNTGDKNVLIDAGNGKNPFTGFDEGNLLHNLESIDLKASDIDAIIITHSDHDHIGGIVDKEGRLEFPNAHYYLSAESWKYWSSSEGRAKIAALCDWPEDRIDFVWGIYSTIQNQMTIVDYDSEFLPGFRMYPAVGHRYDHDVLKIEASGQTLIHLVDSLLHPLFMANRAWYFSYDVAPEQAIETKERLLEWSVSEKAVVFATHFPFPGIGTIQRNDNQWQWLPTRE